MEVSSFRKSPVSGVSPAADPPLAWRMPVSPRAEKDGGLVPPPYRSVTEPHPLRPHAQAVDCPAVGRPKPTEFRRRVQGAPRTESGATLYPDALEPKNPR